LDRHLDFAYPHQRSWPFLTGHCHHLAVALRTRIGGELRILFHAPDWPEDEDVDYTIESLIAEGRVDHVFLEANGLFIDAKGACRDAGDLVVREYWPGGELGTFVQAIEPQHVEALLAGGDWIREPHPDTEALADQIVHDLTAAGLITAGRIAA
jgi:hypothetical protein